MIISTYSKRIYKNKIDTKQLDQLLIDCNDAKIYCYSQLANQKITEKNLNTTYVIKRFDINTYYSNMITRMAKSCVKSNIELQSLYINDLLESVENQNNKITQLKDKLLFWENIKLECINQMKNSKNKTIFPCIFYDNKTILAFNKIYKTDEFEYSYVNGRIQQLKSNLYYAKNRLNKLNTKLEQMKNHHPISCFGTKDFFKKQYTVDEFKKNHKKWKDEFYHKRHNRFVISGSKNHKDGSMCVRYDSNNKNLSICAHKQGSISKTGKYHKPDWFTIPCEFSQYHYNEYLETLQNKENVSYEIVDKGDYYIIMATFEYQYKKQVNDCIDTGIISIDINVDRFALTDLDSKGNLLHRKVLPFNLENKTSNQSIKILESVVHEVLDYCNKYKKPLVREDIKKIQFKATDDKYKNKILTQFAYDKMITTIDRIFEKNSIQVFKVNPNFTSQQGKIKYMCRYGMSIHESAAMCIGRRFLLSEYDQSGRVKKLYYENLLCYNKFGTIQKVGKEFKKLKYHNIYKLEKTPFYINKYNSLKRYIEDVNHYFYNNGEILKRSRKQLKDNY